jgi:integrase
VSEYEALSSTVERDDGDFTGTATHPLIANAPPPPDEPEPPVPIRDLFRDYIAARQIEGRQKDGGKRQEPVIDSLIKFVKHDDARRLTWSEIEAWREHLLKISLSAKTVSDIYLSAVKSLLEWARVKRRLPENVAADVRQGKPKRVLNREQGYTDDEATAIISMSRNYEPLVWINGLIREHPASTAAKRWVPILCAFTGARVSEMTQLRKEDFRIEGDHHVLRITPDAGTVKAGGYRDVPIHKQIIDEGFIDFVDSSPEGPLFSRSPSADIAKQRASAKRLANSLGEWLQELKLVPEGLMPNHAFRHRFKTVGRDLGSSDRVMDAICGHRAIAFGNLGVKIVNIARTVWLCRRLRHRASMICNLGATRRTQTRFPCMWSCGENQR